MYGKVYDGGSLYFYSRYNEETLIEMFRLSYEKLFAQRSQLSNCQAYPP
jgi:hypothetical protein